MGQKVGESGSKEVTYEAVGLDQAGCDGGHGDGETRKGLRYSEEGERMGNEDKVERKQAWARLDFSVSTRASWNLNVMPLGNISKNIMPRVLILILESEIPESSVFM